MFRYGVAAAALMALSRPVAAQEPHARDEAPPGQLTFRVFAGADGLRNLVINGIAQDRDGFLWLGTDEGVYRFDGERFTHFSTADGLTSSSTLVVGVDPEGAPCIGAITGLVCWNGTRFSQATEAGLPAVPVHALASFAGKLWVGTEGHGLFVREPSGAFVRAQGWAGAATVRALWADEAGLVVGDGATVQLTSGDGVWRRLGEFGSGDGEQVNGVLRDLQGAMWIRSPSHLWFLPRGATRATDLHAGLPDDFVVAGVPASMVIGRRGDVLLGTDLGVAYRDGDHWRLMDRSVGMPGATTRTIFVDREGTLWVGTAGLSQLRGRGLVEHYDVTTGLAGDDVWSYQRDAHGTLWIGTNRCLSRATSGRWECLRGTEGRMVRSFVFPPQGGVFVGGAPSDLIYVGPDGHVTSLGDATLARDRSNLVLALDSAGDLWIGTETGLDRLRGATPGPIEHVIVPGLRPDGRFAALLVAGDALWASDERGLAVLEHGAWHTFGPADGFPAAAGMRYLLRRADGRFCVAHIEAVGVTCFRYAGGVVSQLERIGPAQGLSTGMVYFLGEDRERRLWLGTGDGVDVITPAGIDHFDQSDGLAGDDSIANAFLLDRDGSLWLGASGGATHLLAQYYRGPLAPPRTTFLTGRLGGFDLDLDRTRSTTEVPHEHNALTLDFAPSTLLEPKRLEYQVRLLPIDREWTTTRERHHHFPALPSDAYRFAVRTRIGTGSWGPTTELGFAILPAWWQTRWFVVLVVAGALAAIAGAFTWRQRRVLSNRTRLLHARSDASFRAVIDAMPDLISVYRDRRLIYLNHACRQFLGITSEDRWEELDPTDWLHPGDRALVIEVFRRLRALDPKVSSEVFEIRLRAADASWRVCELSGILAEIGGAHTIVISARDVTERKRMRAKLLVTDRMASLGTLAAGIAHEINNPLAYVIGNLEALAETVEAAGHAPIATCGELSGAIHDARDGAERVRKIVQGLRSFSRSEDEERVPLALPGVLDAAIRLTANQVRHRAQLVRELAATPLVIADDGRLTQVFINLLVNAAHAIPEGHSDENRITLRTRTDDHGRAVVEIEDTGRGMAPDVQSRVFDPFFTTKNVGEGTGLGLSICHGIISGLGGQITIESTVARGTIVRVVLPGQPGVAAVFAPAPEPDTAPPVRQRRRVLLVDDEPQVAQTMERLLRKDYDVTIALCGRDGLKRIADGLRFDAIVSDVMMPNMTGIELLEELCRIAPDQARRMIFLSGGTFTAQTRERLDELGAPQLEKPVTAKQLRATVAQIATTGTATPLAATGTDG